MKNIINHLSLFLAISILLSIKVQSQESSGGFPVYFQNKSVSDSLKGLSSIFLPYINNELEEQNANSIDISNNCEGKYYGKGIDVSIDIKSQGQMLILNDSSKLWTLKIESSTAYALQFYFDKFKLPDGATLYFFKEDKTIAFGAFTSANNPIDESKPIKFGTQIIRGKKISIEYHEPKDADFEGQLQIIKIIHVFKTIFSEHGPFSDEFTLDCNKNVSCPEGNGWEKEIKSVVMILGYDEENELMRWCSGGLINNTDQDGRPLLLTANHCIDGVGPMFDYSTWTFLFNHQSPDCNSDGSDVSSSLFESAYGSTLLASDGPGSPTSDYLLLELNTISPDILADYGACLAGWTLTTDPQPPFTGIHHPNGDIKKISIANDPIINTTYHWGAHWATGTTQKGSSGSPLFDNNHKIIGQDHYGNGNVCPPIKTTYYGKFTTSWQQGGFSFWLDPYSSGVTSLNAYCPTVGSCGNGICEPGEDYNNCPFDCYNPYVSPVCLTKLSEDGFDINGKHDGVVEVCIEDNITISPVFPNANYPPSLCPHNYFRLQKVKITDKGHCSDVQSNAEHINTYDCYEWRPWLIGDLHCTCSCYQIFLSIQECDYDLNPIGSENAGWVNIPKDKISFGNGYAIESFNLLNYLPQIGVTLQEGKHYKLKLAQSYWDWDTYPPLWDEYTRYIHTYKDNININGQELYRDLYGKNIVLENVTVNQYQDINVIANNYIKILPNSTLKSGTYKIDNVSCDQFTYQTSKYVEETSNTTNNNVPSNNKIITDNTTKNVKIDNSNIVMVYPNPANANIQVSYNSPKDEQGIFEIYDLIGRKLLSYPLFAGKNTFNISGTILDKGIYLYQIIIGNKIVATDKIVVIK